MPEQDPNPPSSEPIETSEGLDQSHQIDEPTPSVESANETPTANPPQEPPVLDVHPPHETIHTWKDFVIHIAAIAVGLLLAIGLEQTVEYIHHLHQARDLQDALMQESLTNRDVVKADITSIDSAIVALRAERADLDRQSVSAARPAFASMPHLKNFYVLPVSNTAWLTVRDGGSLSLLSRHIVDDYWHTEYYSAESTGQIQDLFKDFYETGSLVYMRKDKSVRSPEEKAQLMQGFSRLLGDLQHLRSTLLSFDEANEIAISGEAFTEKKMQEISRQESAPPTD
jgi:hypothetical protein